MALTTPNNPEALQTPHPTSKKRKATAKTPSTTFTGTFRKLNWTYLHLTLLSNANSTSLTSGTAIDEITARTHLTAALDQFLGLTGTAIPIDILKVKGQDVWVRVPRMDAQATVEALSGWIGGGQVQQAWRVKARSEWLGALDGGYLFDE